MTAQNADPGRDLAGLIEDELFFIGPQLRDLHHARVHLDANARVFIAEHLAAVISGQRPTRYDGEVRP